MRRRALVIGLLSAACGKSRKPAPPIHWLEDVDLAFAEAKRTHRPVFMQFAASWDCAGKELEHRTFPDPDVGALLQSFICVRVDCTDDEDEHTMRHARDFDIKGIPTLVLTDASRRDLHRVTEFVPPEKLAVILRAARARHESVRDA